MTSYLFKERILVQRNYYKFSHVTLTLALELPPHWDPMHEEVFKKITLQPNSPEYQNVAQGFLNTARYKIQKVSMPTHENTHYL